MHPLGPVSVSDPLRALIESMQVDASTRTALSFDVVFSTVLFALVGFAALLFALHALLVARNHLQKLQVGACR